MFKRRKLSHTGVCAAGSPRAPVRRLVAALGDSRAHLEGACDTLLRRARKGRLGTRGGTRVGTWQRLSHTSFLDQTAVETASGDSRPPGSDCSVLLWFRILAQVPQFLRGQRGLEDAARTESTRVSSRLANRAAAGEHSSLMLEPQSTRGTQSTPCELSVRQSSGRTSGAFLSGAGPGAGYANLELSCKY